MPNLQFYRIHKMFVLVRLPSRHKVRTRSSVFRSFAFLNIIAKFPKSPLIPKVKIGLAICLAQQGKKDEATRVLNEWLKAYPQNELITDVKAILAELQK